ncbi:myc box-dependent-interacting 1 isoform X1 [Olea europaea subsp. europaea]|uniref:Myc box-dependent-interacting 1 isoform X1 n=1 Tax=Olea europaea subsp. europaea TaxID=158383 RepID=A0A8S0SEY1_OLEEU|nr:myc box-dependent-interacting 1 isoform X1 [Olea europaea subsp. europaea]
MRHFAGDKAPLPPPLPQSPVGGLVYQVAAVGRRAERLRGTRSGCQLAAGQRSAARLARRQKARASVAPRPLGPLSNIAPLERQADDAGADPPRDDAGARQVRQGGAQVAQAQVAQALVRVDGPLPPPPPQSLTREAKSGSEPEKISKIISVAAAVCPNNLQHHHHHHQHHSNRESESSPETSGTKAARDHDEVANRVSQPEAAYANGERDDPQQQQQVPKGVSEQQAARVERVEVSGERISNESQTRTIIESDRPEASQEEPPRNRPQEQAGPSMSSTYSFVPASETFEQPFENPIGYHPNNLSTRFEHTAQQLTSAPHPVGLGYTVATGQAQVQVRTMMMAGGCDEPVASASDKSIVMTSSISLSPDDEAMPQFNNGGGGRHADLHLSHLRSLGGTCGDSAGSQGGLSGSGSSSGGGGGLAHKQNFLGRFVGKKASRLRELVLQNLGKADRTSDELFDLYEANFYKQQQQVQRLTKEFKLYATALKSYHEASKSLSKSIQQATGDYQLARHDLVCENLSHLEQLNEDLMEKLHEQVMQTLGVYLSKFDETKEKISKRHRKLIDYDSSRRLYELMLASVNKRRSRHAAQQQQQQTDQSGQHQQNVQQQQQQQNYQSILRGLKFLSQQSQQEVGGPRAQQENVASQLVDEARLLKLREQLNYCKLMYENINGELHEELPIIYEKKMKSLLQALQNYYALKAHYHSNAGKLLNAVGEVIEECPQGLETTLLGGLRASQARREYTNEVGEEEEEEDDDDDDDDDVEDGDERHEQNEDSDEAQPKAKALHQMMPSNNSGGGGGGSSGVGSSRGDSVVDSDSPSGTSPSHSPECVERALIGGVARHEQLLVHQDEIALAPPPSEGDDLNLDEQEMGGPGKAEGPADFLASGGRQFAASSSGSVGAGSGEAEEPIEAHQQAGEQLQREVEGLEVEAASGGAVARGPDAPAAAEPEVAAVHQADASERAPDSQPETVYGSAGEPTAAAAAAKVSGGQPVEDPKPQDQIETKVSDTTRPASEKANGEKRDDDDELGESNNGQKAANNLYKVKTNYKYLAEDVDELCFEADEIIQVIEFDENHEPEDGWLLGIREVNNQRGLFPANFTQPI